MILLTGATGRVGSAAANTLLQAGVPFRVLVRDPGKFTLADSSIQVVAGDLGDDVAVADALKGVDRALIVMGNHPDQARLERRFVDLAARAGVSHLVKISSMEASAEATVELPKNHYDTEQHIVAQGLNWTFLRPNYYMQNMLMYAASISRAGQFALPLAGAKTAMVDARDVGAVSAAVLMEEGHAGHIYRLTGPELINFHEVAQRMSRALGSTVHYVEQSPGDFREVLGQFIHSAWQLDAVCELFAEIAKGSLEHLTTDVESLIGRPPLDLEAFTRGFSSAFAPQS